MLGGSGSSPCQSAQLLHGPFSLALGKFFEASQLPKRRVMGRNRLPSQQRLAGAEQGQGWLGTVALLALGSVKVTG